MAISSAGLGSNLDVDSIVKQLMALEQRPLTVLATKEAKYQARISGLGALKGALSALQTAAGNLVPTGGTTVQQKFNVTNSSVTDTAIAWASTTSAAVAGTYSLEVTQLAQQHRIATSTTATPFSGAGGTLATGGTLTLSLGDENGLSITGSTSVEIADGSTPEQVRDAINAANAGVSATVINGVDGKQLVLVGNTPGSDQFIRLSGIDGLSYDGADGDADEFTQMQAAQGSMIKLNGIAVVANTNTITTAIDGITLNLSKKSEAGVATTLTVTRDTSSLSAGVAAFVKAYNDFNTTASNLGKYDATAKVGGTLNGDSTLRSTQSAMRALLGNVPGEVADAALQRLSDIGVSVQKDGSLSIDSSKVSAAISSDFNGVANLMSAYGNAFKAATSEIVGTSGMIASRTDGINESIKSLGKQAQALSSRLTQIEARYRAQFTALDILVASMTKTSSFLSQQLANLPSYNN